jgi:hypothetical protein
LGHAEEEIQRGADRDAASPDRIVDGTGQICAGGQSGSWDIAAELRDELLNGEIFYSLKEAQIVIERWRKHFNTIRAHSTLNYRPPAPQTFAPFRWYKKAVRPGSTVEIIEVRYCKKLVGRGST